MVKLNSDITKPEKLSVLIVDDEPNILLSLEFLMKKNNYQVFIGRNGKEALETLEQHPIDLIILDIMMPEVDGLEVCRRIRENAATQSMKIGRASV